MLGIHLNPLTSLGSAQGPRPHFLQAQISQNPPDYLRYTQAYHLVPIFQTSLKPKSLTKGDLFEEGALRAKHFGESQASAILGTQFTLLPRIIFSQFFKQCNDYYF